ncbi:hypothetical protein VSS74_13205 [Conexibacter stalactiti]|uniref:Uncharacterized protein n=1 Tax=Conexibacter stalactiti TaxID=1940611 RepID=A0ABU4HPS4_9ACTN|nr:hypothetical protein [Conexibacter stalactiti]MDW5595300.1 hypothetical protein [Conexibacter stalactiti]MEC5035942.1 hypothetical protein [Conexibacter stalactiti]
MIAPRWRSHAVIALAVLTAVLLAAAAVAGYARLELVDRDEFSARAVAALDDADVRAVVAGKVVDGLAVSVAPDVLAIRPLVTSAIGSLADRPVFKRVARRAIAHQHAALFNGNAKAAIDLEYAGGLLRDAVRSVSPRVAELIPRGTEPRLVELEAGDIRLTLARKLTNVAGWWLPLLAAALLCSIACGLLAGGLRDGVAYLGAAVAAAGLTVALIVMTAGSWVVARVGSDERSRAAVKAIWEALFGDLRTTALLSALGALVVAGIAAQRPVVLFTQLRRLLGTPARMPRALRGAGLLLLGAAIVLEPSVAVRAVSVIAGLLLILLGIGELRGRAGRAAGAAGDGAVAEERPTPGRTLAVVGIVAGVVTATVIAVALVLPAPKVEAPPALAALAGPAGACNGSVELCGKRLNEVVFPSTHNSYAAAAEPGWLFPNQRHGIERQLRDGIRGLLIDIHWGELDPATGLVRTDLDAEGSDRNKVAQELSPQALRTADRLVGRIGVGTGSGNPTPYLCHTLCELGSEPLDEQFEIIARFLAANPGEVLVLFIEPYVPVAVTEAALERTGLLSQAAELQRDEPLPTLGELVRDDTRLVIFAEQDGGSRSWYLDGFSFVQDTPLGATKASELSCERWRGTPDSPLLMLNHWTVTFPPSVSRNERIGNSVLWRQMARCEREREMLPNLVAVDFYERTGVVRLAHQRNELAAP